MERVIEEPVIVVILFYFIHHFTSIFKLADKHNIKPFGLEP